MCVCVCVRARARCAYVGLDNKLHKIHDTYISIINYTNFVFPTREVLVKRYCKCL